MKQESLDPYADSVIKDEAPPVEEQLQEQAEIGAPPQEPVQTDDSTQQEPILDAEGNEIEVERKTAQPTEDFEGRAKHFQSKHDKADARANRAEAQLGRMEHLTKLDEFLQSDPRIMEELKAKISGGNGKESAEPELKPPVKPQYFDINEGLENPGSESAKYMREMDRFQQTKNRAEMRAEMRIMLDEQQQQQTQKHDQATAKAEMVAVLDKAGLSKEQQVDFFDRVQSGKLFNPDALLYAWQHEQGLTAKQVVEGNKTVTAHNHIKTNQEIPPSVGTVTSTDVPEKSEEEVMLDNMVDAHKKRNRW